MARIAGTWMLVALLLSVQATGSHAQETAGDWSLARVQQAFAAVERAGDYDALLAAVTEHAATIGDPRLPGLIDGLLPAAQDDAQRNILLLERALCVDVAAHGAPIAARLSAIRLLALAALRADSAEELAVSMERYAPLAAEMDAASVSLALTQPAQWWPADLPALLHRLGSDWGTHGALDAARRMAANAAALAPADAAATGGAIEDRIGNTLIELGEPIPDGLIHIPQY